MKIPQIKVSPTHSSHAPWAWCAYIDGMEETTTVVGATPQAAVTELVDQMLEDCEEDISLTR